MMNPIVNSDAEVRRYIQNVFATIEGETTLFTKLQPDLEASQRWLESIVPVTLIEGDEEQNSLLQRIVVLEAFRRAVPSLDLVLTPNGFGIVSNDNISPASKERVNALLQQLEFGRDDLIQQLVEYYRDHHLDMLSEFPQYSAWVDTIFRPLEFEQLTAEEHRLSAWIRNRDKVRQAEDDIAYKATSRAIMSKVRELVATNACNGDYAIVRRMILPVIVPMATGKECPIYRLRELADFCNRHFPEWKESETARLYEDVSYQNEHGTGAFVL